MIPLGRCWCCDRWPAQFTTGYVEVNGFMWCKACKNGLHPYLSVCDRKHSARSYCTHCFAQEIVMWERKDLEFAITQDDFLKCSSCKKKARDVRIVPDYGVSPTPLPALPPAREEKKRPEPIAAVAYRHKEACDCEVHKTVST